MVLIQKSVKRFMMKAIKTDGILALIDIDRSVAKMADGVMTFPDTWEEFEKHFGFYDIKQAYMFGNTRLIPSFRVQQWLNHLDDIKRKEQSQKNKMEAVAAMFGKKLGEEFKVKVNCTIDKIILCRFSKKGLCYQEDEKWNYEWFITDMVMAQLICGEAVIVNEE